MKMTKLFYLIVASSIIMGAVIMFAVDLTIGALVIAVDFTALGIVYALFFKTLMKNERLAATGVPARARVVDMKDTGVTVNDIYRQIDFTLEVQPEKGEPYEVQARGLVHPTRISSFQPGSMIPVSVDASNPLEVAIGGKEEVERGGMATSTPTDEQKKQIEDMLERNEKEKQDILAKGKEAKAVILKAWELGINVNGKNPAMQFMLEVLPEGGEPFQAQATGVIAEASIPKYQVGNSITVMYDPDNLTRVALLHS